MPELDLFGEIVVDTVDRRALARSTYHLVPTNDGTTPGCDDCKFLLVPEPRQAWHCSCQLTHAEVDSWRGTCSAEEDREGAEAERREWAADIARHRARVVDAGGAS